MKLIEQPIKRFFAFGCSFTNYHWATWPEILSLDLAVPFWNYGQSGAGNQYIANSITQADQFFNFDENDLIIVSWTNVCREDRWINNNWITPGNIYSQNFYDEKYIKKYVDPNGYLLRDLSLIHLVDNMLQNKKCQYHFLSMCDIVEQLDQGEQLSFDYSQKSFNEIKNLYKDTVKKINPSFYKILWDNNIQKNKFKEENKFYLDKFSDGHPTPIEHFRYLKTIFSGHKFSNNTEKIVLEKDMYLKNELLKICRQTDKRFSIYELSSDLHKKFKDNTTVKLSKSRKFI
jgi:hypothetical protein